MDPPADDCPRTVSAGLPTLPRMSDHSTDDLTLEEKCRLLGGATTWRTHAIERVGIPAVKMSDGPNGVRGDGIGASRVAGVVMPGGHRARCRPGTPNWSARSPACSVAEAVRKGAHVLLAPTVNLQRTPIGGRVFECYSEDPELTARLAVAFVHAVQAHDVAVTVKHFCLNDTEIDRMSVNVEVDDRTLRELYLRPFEAAVVEGGAWGIMSAYNRYAGEHCRPEPPAAHPDPARRVGLRRLRRVRLVRLARHGRLRPRRSHRADARTRHHLRRGAA